MKENIIKIVFLFARYKHLNHILKVILELHIFIIKELHLQFNSSEIIKIIKIKWINKNYNVLPEWKFIIKHNKTGKLNGLIVMKAIKIQWKIIIFK
jgi:hypothetical protein